MRTAHGMSPAVPAAQMLASILMFAAVYLLLFAVLHLPAESQDQARPGLTDGDAASSTEDPRLTIQSRRGRHNGLRNRPVPISTSSGSSSSAS